MENASKALIMAAGVIVGVLIISIGVYLFYTYADYSLDAYKAMESAQIDQFNSQFLKYYGNTLTKYTDANKNEYSKETPILCTTHDIVTLATLANQNNKEFNLENESRV